MENQTSNASVIGDSNIKERAQKNKKYWIASLVVLLIFVNGVPSLGLLFNVEYLFREILGSYGGGFLIFGVIGLLIGGSISKFFFKLQEKTDEYYAKTYKIAIILTLLCCWEKLVNGLANGINNPSK